MRTLGVDLAKSPMTTAMCTVRWEPARAVVESVRVGVDDETIQDACNGNDVGTVALDAPFGWPRAMVSAVASWRPGGRWAGPSDETFRLRETDRWVRRQTLAANGAGSVTPLSVSADKIAMAAWRCCKILDELAQDGGIVVTDGLGDSFAADGRFRVVEAYPAAALAMWRIPRKGYKSEEGRAAREAMLTCIDEAGAVGWLVWADDTRATCAATDHALDAVICALVARAAMLGLVEKVEAPDAARTEGWIALPTQQSLAALARGA